MEILPQVLRGGGVCFDSHCILLLVETLNPAQSIICAASYILNSGCTGFHYFKCGLSRIQIWGALLLGSQNNTPDKTNAGNNAVNCYEESVQFSDLFVLSPIASFTQNFVFLRPSNTNLNCEYTTWQVSCISFIHNWLNVLQLHGYLPNPARNLAGFLKNRWVPELKSGTSLILNCFDNRACMHVSFCSRAHMIGLAMKVSVAGVSVFVITEMVTAELGHAGTTRITINLPTTVRMSGSTMTDHGLTMTGQRMTLTNHMLTMTNCRKTMTIHGPTTTTQNTTTPGDIRITMVGDLRII